MRVGLTRDRNKKSWSHNYDYYYHNYYYDYYDYYYDCLLYTSPSPRDRG